MSVDLTLPLAGRLIGDIELMARASLGRDKFYELKKARFFDFLLARPAVPGRSRYCGELVARWIAGAGKAPVASQAESPDRRGLRVAGRSR